MQYRQYENKSSYTFVMAHSKITPTGLFWIFHTWNQSLLMPLLKLNRIQLYAHFFEWGNFKVENHPPTIQEQKSSLWISFLHDLIVFVLSSLSCLFQRASGCRLATFSRVFLLCIAYFCPRLAVGENTNQSEVGNSILTDIFHRGVDI